MLYGSVQALSGLCGNTFTYFQFKEDNEISPEDRDVFIAVLLTITCVGIAINLLLLPMPWAKASAQKKITCSFQNKFIRQLYSLQKTIANRTDL